MCAEHAGMYVGFRYGAKPHAVMLLPSVTHWLNYDYVSLMLTAVIYWLSLFDWVVFCQRTGNAH